MNTKELIKKLQEQDPSGELELMVDAGCYDYPVNMGRPNVRYVSNKTDEWCEYDERYAEKVISVTADN